MGPPDWPLRTQPQLREQATDRRFTEHDPKARLDHLTNDLRGPQGIGELHLQRILRRDGAIDPGEGLAIQLRRTSAALLCIQGPPSTPALPSQPAIEGHAMDPQSLGHDFRALSLLHAAHCARPQFREGCMIKPSRIVWFHAYGYTTSDGRCTYYYETVNNTSFFFADHNDGKIRTR
jgi:hypothetical protein